MKALVAPHGPSKLWNHAVTRHCAAATGAEIMLRTVRNEDLRIDAKACAQCSAHLLAAPAGVPLLPDQLGEQPRPLELEPDTTLYEESSPGATVYTVCKGMVKLLRRLPNGTQRIVRVLREGDVMGLELLVDGLYHHSAVSLGHTTLCPVSAPTLQEMAQAQPERYTRLLQRWQGIVDEADFVITQLSTGGARGRVARLLLHLSDRSGEGACHSLTREDMGALLGLTTETTSRVMAAFKRDGAVRESRGRLQCNAKALQPYAQE